MKKLSNAFNTILKPQIFAVVYLVWLCINMIAVINPLPFTRIFLALSAVWAAAVCVKQYFFSGLTPYKKKWMPLLFAFLLTGFLALLIQFKYSGVKMLVQFCFFAVAILLLYAQYGSDSKTYQKVMLQTSKAIGIIISITMLISIVMFVLLYSNVVTLRTGTELHFGFYENRLVGVFTSPNVGGAFALICIWASLLTIELHQEKKLKIFWRVLSVIQIVLSATYISLALSRGTYVAVYVFLAFYLLLYAPLKKEEGMKIGKRIALRLISTVLICALSAGAFSVLHTISTQIMNVYYTHHIGANSGDAAALDPVKAETFQNAQLGFDGRTEANRADIDVSNKRFDIWETHLSFLKGKNLLFGIGNPVNYYKTSLAEGVEFTEHQKTFVEWAIGNMHNGYIQVLVNCGIVPFLLFIAFLLICGIKAIQFIIGLGSKRIDPKSPAAIVFTLSLPIVCACLVNNLMESNFVLMGASFLQAIFWFAAGACVQAIEETKTSKNGVVKK